MIGLLPEIIAVVLATKSCTRVTLEFDPVRIGLSCRRINPGGRSQDKAVAKVRLVEKRARHDQVTLGVESQAGRHVLLDGTPVARPHRSQAAIQLDRKRAVAGTRRRATVSASIPQGERAEAYDTLEKTRHSHIAAVVDRHSAHHLIHAVAKTPRSHGRTGGGVQLGDPDGH